MPRAGHRPSSEAAGRYHTTSGGCVPHEIEPQEIEPLEGMTHAYFMSRLGLHEAPMFRRNQFSALGCLPHGIARCTVKCVHVPVRGYNHPRALWHRLRPLEQCHTHCSGSLCTGPGALARPAPALPLHRSAAPTLGQIPLRDPSGLITVAGHLCNES